MIYLNSARLFGRVVRLNNGFCIPALQGRTTTMATSAAPSSDIRAEDFWKKNDRLKRPISPHLTIYKLQITSVMSVTHRATGLALSGVLYSFALGALVMPGSFPQCISTLQAMHISPALLIPMKFAVAWSFFYHLANGIRHLAWDLGHGYEIKSLYTSGYVVLGTSIALGLATALM